MKSPTIDLKYHYKFPVGFDFGKSTGGKMPGLYGGVPGLRERRPALRRRRGRPATCGAAAARARPTARSTSTPGPRPATAPILGVGSWHWLADGQWHSIEQRLDLAGGQLTIWHDGKQVFETKRSFGGTPLTGIFFSTFHGGHDTGWSPTKPTMAEFAAFTLSTEGPQTEAAAADAGVDAAAVSDGPGVGEAGPGVGGASGGAGGATGGAGAGRDAITPGTGGRAADSAGGFRVDGRHWSASTRGPRLPLGRRHRSQWSRGHRRRARSGAPPTAEQVAKVALTTRPAPVTSETSPPRGSRLVAGSAGDCAPNLARQTSPLGERSPRLRGG